MNRLTLRLVILALAGTLVWQAPVAADRQGPGPSTLLEPIGSGKVDPTLLKQVLAGEPGDSYHFIVEMVQQANLADLPVGQSSLDRRQDVVKRLQATASQTQADLLTYLQARQAKGQVQQIRPFWIFNGLAITASADTLLALAARPDVRALRPDRWRQWIEPSFSPDSQSSPDPDDVSWNIARVRADLAWTALGLDGEGITVAIMDTGVDWQHPALQAQYRGYKPGGLAFHEGNWACTTDEEALYPVDGHGHGTHVAGTAVGGRDGSGQAIGVAPGAWWIAVKAFNNIGYAHDSWLHAAFEWLMAPAGDPARAPDIVNGSWGDRDGGDETFRADLQALRAAGIVPVFAAGNYGPDGFSLISPASYPEAIAVGATDDLDQVTSFSSRGPSPWDEVKPEVVAPGAQIRSSLPGGAYGLANGTSMATPHVSGQAALLLQADPTLTVDQVEALLTSTALPLGKEAPNNATGWGRVDAYQAASVALKAGFVAGRVSRYPDGEPLPIAWISVYDDLDQRRALVQADSKGHYRVALPPGRYRLSVEAFGYAPQTQPVVSIQTDQITTVDVSLSPLPAGALWGQIRDAQTGGPVGAALSVLDTPAQTSSDPQTGHYSLVLPAGTYTVQVAQNGYRRRTISGLEIVADQTTRLDAALTPAPTLLLVDSGRWYYGSQAGYLEQALDDHDYVYDLWEIRDRTLDLPTLDMLSAYETTIWSSPLDSPGLIGAGDTISNYLGTGGSLFLTGQDVGFWDSGLSGRTWHPYYRDFLRVKAVEDDASRADLVGLPDDILHDLSLPMNGPESADNQLFPDAITLLDPNHAAILGHYADDGDAAVRASGCQSYRAVYLAAGLEGLGDRASRAEVLDRSLSWLATPFPAVAAELLPPDQDQVWLSDTFVTYTVELRNTGQYTDQFGLELSPSSWATSLWNNTFTHPLTQSITLSACQTQTLGLKVTLPPDVAWNVTDAVTLTARSLADPGSAARATFHTKAPAPILLVDDHRWYDTLGAYQGALAANGLPYDLWKVAHSPHPYLGGPSLQRLQRYRVVVWFTGYDWYRTLTPYDEGVLTTYLDGGGRLLLSSQDYLYTSGFTSFAGDYLGVASYTEGLTATVVTGALGSPIGDPFGPMDLTYPFHNWSDALRPTPAAQLAFWGQHAQPVALTLARAPWKTAFFAFPLETLSSQDMAAVLGRAVDWLSPLGDAYLTVDRPVAAAGEQLAYTLLIRNTGPALLSDVSLSNPVPLSATYLAGSLAGPAEYDPATDRFIWHGALAPGQAVTISYRLQLATDLPDGTVVRNTAHLSDESGLALDRVAVSRLRTPDLSRSIKAASTSVGQPSQMLTYTLILQNNGLRSAQASLTDPFPLHTVALPGAAQASSGLLTPTAEALLWTGDISVGQAVTITFPVVISPTAAASYVLNRATLDDGYGALVPLEAATWVQAYAFLPLILKQD